MQHLTRDELRELLRCARGVRERDWLMILVGFWHGLRATEVISLTPANVRDGFLTVPRLKGSLKTTQPLIVDADPLLDERQALEQHAATCGLRDRLFPITRIQFYRLMRRHCASAGIAAHKAHPHVLKHSIAMQTIRDAGIENVRAYLGHKNISSTGAYLKVDDDQASAAIAAACKPR